MDVILEDFKRFQVSVCGITIDFVESTNLPAVQIFYNLPDPCVCFLLTISSGIKP